MSLPHATLGVLATGPRHGRAVARALARLLHGLRPVGAGQVYATLGRLTRHELVRATGAGASGARGAPLRTYAVTPAGRCALSRWLARAEIEPEVADGFVARLLVLHALQDQRGMARLIAARRARLAEMHAGLAARARAGSGRAARGATRAAAQDATHDASRAAADELLSLVREAASRLVAAEIAWLADAERALGPEVGGTPRA